MRSPNDEIKSNAKNIQLTQRKARKGNEEKRDTYKSNSKL